MNLIGTTGRKLAIAGGLMVLATSAHAELSSTITATTDYDFRGYSQTAKDPALQASLDYDFGDTGFFVGAWATNVDFGDDADIELDLYGGYAGSINERLGWSAGATYYVFPGSDDSEGYPEIFFGLESGPLSFVQWYSWDFYGLDEEYEALYSELNGTFELAGGFSLLMHVGYNWGDYWKDVEGGELLDYSIGVGYELDRFSLDLRWYDTDASGDMVIRDDVLNNEGRVIFSVSTTLPWGE